MNGLLIGGNIGHGLSDKPTSNSTETKQKSLMIYAVLFLLSLKGAAGEVVIVMVGDELDLLGRVCLQHIMWA